MVFTNVVDVEPNDDDDVDVDGTTFTAAVVWDFAIDALMEVDIGLVD